MSFGVLICFFNCPMYLIKYIISNFQNLTSCFKDRIDCHVKK